MQFQSWLQSRKERQEGEFEGVEPLQAQPPPAINHENHQNEAYDQNTTEGVMRESVLQQWLVENKLSKLTQTFIENEVALDDLLDLAANPDDAIVFCDENDLKGLIKRRFIRALQKLHSEHNKRNGQNDDNSSNISPAEENALKLIETSMNSNKLQIDNLSQIQIPQLTQYLQENTALIDCIFDEIIKCAMNRKKELQLELSRKTNHKQQQIQRLLAGLKKRQKGFHQCLQRSQSFVNDRTLDPDQRKRKILELTTEILSATAPVTQSISNLKVKTQQTQMDAIRIKLMKVVLIEDISDPKEDSTECKEADIEKAVFALSGNKKKKRRKRKRKGKKKENRASNIDKSEPNKDVSAALSSVASPATIAVQNTYQAVKDNKVVSDSWSAYPVQQNEAQPHRYKMEQCRFYLLYKSCHRGKNCTFAHSEREQKQYNPYAKMRICRFVEMKQECPYMAQFGVCNDIHPEHSTK